MRTYIALLYVLPGTCCNTYNHVVFYPVLLCTTWYLFHLTGSDKSTGVFSAIGAQDVELAVGYE